MYKKKQIVKRIQHNGKKDKCNTSIYDNNKTKKPGVTSLYDIFNSTSPDKNHTGCDSCMSNIH